VAYSCYFLSLSYLFLSLKAFLWFPALTAASPFLLVLATLASFLSARLATLCCLAVGAAAFLLTGFNLPAVGLEAFLAATPLALTFDVVLAAGFFFLVTT
jgi:hypothetical protein